MWLRFRVVMQANRDQPLLPTGLSYASVVCVGYGALIVLTRASWLEVLLVVADEPRSRSLSHCHHRLWANYASEMTIVILVPVPAPVPASVPGIHLQHRCLKFALVFDCALYPHNTIWY